jgi:hypothetical protein
MQPAGGGSLQSAIADYQHFVGKHSPDEDMESVEDLNFLQCHHLCLELAPDPC